MPWYASAKPGPVAFTMAVLIVGASLLVYAGNGEHVLLNWDDRTYVTDNPWVTNPGWSNSVAAFTQERAGNWHPLSWLSYVPEYELCGDRAACYKFTNSVLHGINALLVTLLTWQVLGLFAGSTATALGGGGTDLRGVAAALTGLLFAIHPQHVESVIWVAERKDLLCGLFYFGALAFYLDGRARNRPRSAPLAFVAFVLAILSKSMAVTLPAILVLLDVALAIHCREPVTASWLLRQGLLRKAHYWGVSAAAIAMTLNSQAVAQIDQPGPLMTLAICLAALEHYIRSFFLPWGLSPFYPQEIVTGNLMVYWPLLPIALLATLCVWRCQPRDRLLLLMGLGFFLITLSPVIGVVKVGEQAYADRYTYIPMLGFYMAAALAVAGAWERLSDYRLAMATLVLAVLVLLSLQTHRYKETWRDDLTFWSVVVQRYPGAGATPWVNLGNSHYGAQNHADAMASYRQALALDPGSVTAWINLATVYQALGDQEQALVVYSEGAERNPGLAGLQSRAGRAHMAAGNMEQAGGYLETALALRPDLPDALLGMGEWLLRQGRAREAVAYLERVPVSMPQFLPANLLLVQAYQLSAPSRARELLSELERTYGNIPPISALRQRQQRD